MFTLASWARGELPKCVMSHRIADGSRSIDDNASGMVIPGAANVRARPDRDTRDRPEQLLVCLRRTTTWRPNDGCCTVAIC